MNGDPETLNILARRTLLDALEILGEHRFAVILVGAQAIYLHLGEAELAVAATTKDADLALDARILGPAPRIEDALRAAGFESPADQIGIWRSPSGGQVDFLVPEAIAGPRGRRAARLDTQGRTLARRAVGLEGVLVDNAIMAIRSMEPDDGRQFSIRVAGTGALLVAKLHKIGERQDTPTRLIAKDALDLLRLLQGVPTEILARSIRAQLDDPIAATVARRALGYLRSLFANEGAVGPQLAGQAVEGLADQGIIKASSVALAFDLLEQFESV